jgi:hypothetical protein
MFPMFAFKRLGAVSAVAGLAALGVAAMPGEANAWWRGGGIGIGVYLPPVVVAPAPVYAPPAYYVPPAYGPPAYYAPPAPAYYPPPRHVWVPPHWQNGYWIPGHWA